MSIEVCPGCTCRFAVGLLRCPQCGTVAPLFADQLNEHEEKPMPRITAAGGPSNAAAQPGEPGYVEPAPDVASEPAEAATEPDVEPETEPEPGADAEAGPEANLADPVEDDPDSAGRSSSKR